MIAVDASVAVPFLTDRRSLSTTLVASLMADVEWVVPGHFHGEVVSALRGLWIGKKLSEERAARAVTVLQQFAMDVVPLAELVDEMWSQRHNLTPYDAAYLGTAKRFDCDLATVDQGVRVAAEHAGVTVLT